MEQMYSTYWIVVTWRSNWAVTWHVGWGLLFLAITLLIVSLAPCQSEEKTFLICHLTKRSKSHWLCSCGPFILSYHLCRTWALWKWKCFLFFCVTMWLKCHVTLWVGFSVYENPKIATDLFIFCFKCLILSCLFFFHKIMKF